MVNPLPMGALILMVQRHLRVVGSGYTAGWGAAAPAPGPPACAPDLAAVRALAECSELASAVSGLADADGTPLTAGRPGGLARDIARDLVEAGFAVHRCYGWDPARRLGGVCVRPVPAHADPEGDGGVVASWAVHDLLARDPDREQACQDAREIMNLSLAEMLFALGYEVRPVAGRRSLDGDRPPSPGGGGGTVTRGPAAGDGPRVTHDSQPPSASGPARRRAPAGPWR